MELGAIGSRRADRNVGVDGLVQDRNGSPGSRHLLLTAVLKTAANTKKSLNTQEGRSFLQVPGLSTSP
jgi:hypothetical protein